MANGPGVMRCGTTRLRFIRANVRTWHARGLGLWRKQYQQRHIIIIIIDNESVMKTVSTTSTSSSLSLTSSISSLATLLPDRASLKTAQMEATLTTSYYFTIDHNGLVARSQLLLLLDLATTIGLLRFAFFFIFYFLFISKYFLKC